MAPRIRPARADDLAGLTQLYNHYVRAGPVTFDLEPIEIEARRAWLEQFGETGRHRLLVAQADGVANLVNRNVSNGEVCQLPAVEQALECCANHVPGRKVRRAEGDGAAVVHAIQGDPEVPAVGTPERGAAS